MTPTPTTGRLRRAGGWLRQRRGALAWVLVVVVAVGAFALGTLAGTWRNICAQCPSIAQLSVWEPLRASRVLDRNGLLITEFYRERRTPIRLAELPEHVPQAFVAIEDKRFYQHHGLDYRRLVSANVRNVLSGRITGGGSTISQQLARWMFAEEIGFEQVVTRKLKEMHVARQLEEVYSKDQILEAYINQVNYGHGKYGIETAARYYFGKTAPELNPAEAALLAAVINAPSRYSPFRHPERARARRNTVLSLMARQGYLSAADAEQWRAADLPEEPQGNGDGELAPYFVEWVRDALDDRYGEALYSAGLRVHTTLDLHVQRRAAEAMDSGWARIENAPGYSRPRYATVKEERGAGQMSQVPYLQGLLLAMDPDSGDVLALIGGRDFGHSRFNRVTQALRQPGSLFKPFVYATAIQQGVPASHVMYDAPILIELPEGGEYSPRNYDPEFRGPLTLRDALKHSVNTIAVQLGQDIGMENVARTARQMGLDTEVPPYPSTAIGAADVIPLQLATAYTAFANAGVAVMPRAVLRVEDAEGRVLWQTRPQREVVMDSLTAAIVRDMMRTVVDNGTGYNARAVGQGGLPAQVPAAGKTGTTNDYTDVWFMGFTPDILATVWFGFDQPRRIIGSASGGRFAAPVWGQFVNSLYFGEETLLEVPEPWRMPGGLSTRVVDRTTGALASDWCDPQNAYLEYFVPGTEPTEVCSPYDRGLFRGPLRQTDVDTADGGGRFRIRRPPPDTTGGR